MNAFFHRIRSWGRPWDVLMAVIAGVIIFAGLSLATAGLFVAVVCAMLGAVALGVVEYFLWGRPLLHQAVRQHPPQQALAPVQAELVPPVDEFNLALTEGERTELIAILEQSLSSPQGLQPVAQRQTRRELLDRLRGFGV